MINSTFLTNRVLVLGIIFHYYYIKEKGCDLVKTPKIVVLGAGYGGMITTVRLQKALSVNEAEITLVNNNSYHYQATWLHESAAGTLQDEKICLDIQDVIDTNKVNFVQDTVVEIKAAENALS